MLLPKLNAFVSLESNKGMYVMYVRAVWLIELQVNLANSNRNFPVTKGMSHLLHACQHKPLLDSNRPKDLSKKIVLICCLSDNQYQKHNFWLAVAAYVGACTVYNIQK